MNSARFGVVLETGTRMAIAIWAMLTVAGTAAMFLERTAPIPKRCVNLSDLLMAQGYQDITGRSSAASFPGGRTRAGAGQARQDCEGNE